MTQACVNLTQVHVSMKHTTCVVVCLGKTKTFPYTQVSVKYQHKLVLVSTQGCVDLNEQSPNNMIIIALYRENL
jgi:hypothetical protein